MRLSKPVELEIAYTAWEIVHNHYAYNKSKTTTAILGDYFILRLLLSLQDTFLLQTQLN